MMMNDTRSEIFEINVRKLKRFKKTVTQVY